MSEHVEQVSRETPDAFRRLSIEQQIEQRRQGMRSTVSHSGTLCSRCLSSPPASAKVRYCKRCHADDERERRKTRKAELKRLRALEKQLSKGKDNGQSTKEVETAPT